MSPYKKFAMICSQQYIYILHILTYSPVGTGEVHRIANTITEWIWE